MDDQTQPTNPTPEEISNSAEEVQSDASGGDALQQIDLERTIKTFHQGIASKRQDVKKHKDMIQDTLDGDQVYVEHLEKVNDAKKVLQETKNQLMAISSIISAKEEMKEMNAEIRDLKKALSENLMKYYEMTGTNNITMDDGETYVIQTSAKLVRQSSKYNP